MTDDYQDGNALAGPLADIFAFDISGAAAVCAGCSRAGVVAELQVYGPAPGLVARCPGCSAVMLRYVETPHGRWLDMRGTAVLRLNPALLSRRAH
jgi:hypothetical protein